MLKIWGPSICKPLEIIFKSCLESGISTGMEKRECCSSSYKNDKQSLENYWPTSLLLRYGKYLNVCYMTRCSGFFYFITLFPWISRTLNLETLALITSYQLPMVYFNERYKVWGVFLDLSKVFDKVLHENLIIKLK